MAKPTTDKSQDSFEFEPEYLESGGVKHEFNGTLFVPTASEMERIEKEAKARDEKPRVVGGEPHLFVPTSMLPNQPRQAVKMKMRDALRFRTKGA